MYLYKYIDYILYYYIIYIDTLIIHQLQELSSGK